MENIYKSGKYLQATKSWHAEDALWKAERITAIMDKNSLRPSSIVEVGCGSGAVLQQLSRSPNMQGTRFEGYDISPQAIEIATRTGNERIRFTQGDLFADQEGKTFDLLMAIDVFEHVPDYMGFVDKCRRKATFKIYHIPLDIHVSSVLRNAFIKSRYTIGHIHYFNAESAIATLRDTGHEIIDYVYTDVALGLFSEHPSMKKAVANVPRWLLAQFSVPFAARLLGGYSLLVLSR
jgi:ubiquinone/menaquinone biosynthesis C-methylase UbiE